MSDFFPIVSYGTFSQVAFPVTILPKGDRTDFAQKERLGFPYWTMILAFCVSVDMSKNLNILTFGIFINVDASSILIVVYADTASAACHELPGNLDIMSMNFSVVI